MTLLNLGIVAHVDAGKTSLTERLLYDAGALDVLGSVDAGTVRTDAMDLERRRGITIRTAVTPVSIGGVDVTIIDTPGHPDFIAEVERSLTVLDAAVLVLSAVEGVQSQTVVLWRALRRVGVPTVLFVNKVDRTGADVDRVVHQIRQRLTGRPVVLARVDRQGQRDVAVQDVDWSDQSVLEAIADNDDTVLTSWVDGHPPGERDLRRAVRRGVRQGSIAPVVCGSAITGAGIAELCRVLTQLVPPVPQRGDGAPVGTVFAVDRDDRGLRAWLRMWSGRIAVRDRVSLSGRRAERVTALDVSRPGGSATMAAEAGEIVAVRGWDGCRVGDTVGTPPRRRRYRFPPPTTQALVEPVDPDRRSELYVALTELAEEDPLLDLRLDQGAGEAVVSLHGEVHREVIAAILDERYGVPARFGPRSTVCLERVVGCGEAVDRIGADGNPYLATIGLRVERARPGHGVEFSPGIERGNLPPAFIGATEEGVRSALQQGWYGWAITDCVVTMTASGYYPRQSHAHQKFNKAMSSVGADFRQLAPVVLFAALARAGTQVCEPVDRFDLDLPEEAVGAVTAALGRLGAVITDTDVTRGYTRLVGELGSERVPVLVRQLPNLTGGEAVFVSELDHHSPIRGMTDPPSRRRHGSDPRDRATWFRDMPR